VNFHGEDQQSEPDEEKIDGMIGDHCTKRKLISHEDISQRVGSKTNLDSPEKDLQSDIEKELDEEEDKWNDRRSFVPKRKLISHTDVSVENEDGNVTDQSNKKVKTSRIATQPATQRIRRSRFSEDSDDEDVNQDSKENGRNSKRMLLEDSDED
jgi:hypothetical protein